METLLINVEQIVMSATSYGPFRGVRRQAKFVRDTLDQIRTSSFAKPLSAKEFVKVFFALMELADSSDPSDPSASELFAPATLLSLFLQADIRKRNSNGSCIWAADDDRNDNDDISKDAAFTVSLWSSKRDDVRRALHSAVHLLELLQVKLWNQYQVFCKPLGATVILLKLAYAQK